MLNWVPCGDVADATRQPGELDRVADFLRACGVKPLDAVVVVPALF